LKEFFIHKLFKAGLALKGINAGIECVGGLLLALTNAQHINAFIIGLTQSEFLHDRRDAVAAALLHVSRELSVSAHHFFAFYLMAHGLVKLVMVYGLARQRSWAYPFALAALAGFILYQSYRFGHSHSIGLALLTIFDCAFFWLVWREYRLPQRKLKAAHEVWSR
jgi:uncharacterized membrane protein